MTESSSSRSEKAAAFRQEHERKERNRQLAAVLGALVVLALIAGGTWWALSRSDSTDYSAGDSPSASSSAGAGQAPANTEGFAVVIGEPDAPKTLRVYEDPQCPICAQFESIVRKPLHSAVSAGKVKVEYRIVSFLDRASANEYSSRAANALLVVADQSGPEVFWKFHDYLYQNQPKEGGPGPDDDDLIKAAVAAGAEEAAISQPIKDKVFEQWIVNATNQMSKDGVTGTPAVWVDGKLVEGSPQDGINAVMEAVK